MVHVYFFFFQAEDGIRDVAVTGVQTCALPISLLALNGREYELDPEITAIADPNGVQSLGGVIGGEATGCTEATSEVFIEAALFDPIRTAATGRRLDITSDARYRFERGIDP